MIDIINYDDGLPISVVIPLSKKRKNFFYKFVLPLIESNEPKEIIINDNDGNAPKKRNDGFLKSTQPYIFFCDDDILLSSEHLENLYSMLIKSKNNIGYTYTGYYGIVMNPNNHPMKGNYLINTIEFDPKILIKTNFISTMSLIKREHFPMFDETLERLQDWDIWLTLLNKNIFGKAVFNSEFYAYYLDDGITSTKTDYTDSYLKLMNKHFNNEKKN